MKKDIIIIGGGASGLTAAICAARLKASAVVLERLDKPGKKLLATGNGRCNYTNQNMGPDYYRSRDMKLCTSVLKQCPHERVTAFLKELGIWPKSRNGYMYPASDQAASVVQVLLMALEELKVPVLTGEPVREIVPSKGRFTVNTEKSSYTAGRVILAPGGRAYPKLGSDGSGYDLAEALGHRIVPVVPALTALRCKESFFKSVAGVRIYAKASLLIDGRHTASDTGEVQLTGYGISGIPVFQISRYAAYALKEGRTVLAVLNFMPDMSENQCFKMLQCRIRQSKGKNAGQMLIGLFNQKLIPVLLKCSNIRIDKAAASMSEKDIFRLVQNICRFEVNVAGTNSFEEAQVCAGGVDTVQIDSKTMASKLVPGLYMSGELLDVDGMCGGYNLNFAIATGMIAGTAAAGGNICSESVR